MKGWQLALFAGAISAASMAYLFNHGTGTNNEVALKAGAITGVSILAATRFKVL